MKQTLDVVRVQMVNWPAIIAWPLGILASTLLINILIFQAIGEAAPPEGRVTGGLVAVYIVMLVAHLQTMTQVFPFVIGMGVTRRRFWIATALLVLVQAAVLGFALTVLGAIEEATNGWGIDLDFLRLGFLVQSNVVLQWLVYTVPFVTMSAIGVLIGAVFKRWGSTGLYVLGIGSAFLVTGAVLLLTWQRWWPEFARFFTEQSTLALVVGYPLVIALALGGLSFLTIRRATP